MEKLVFGIVWCIGLYITAAMVVGGVAGEIAGTRSPDARSTSQAGYWAGANAVKDNRGYIIAGAVLLSAVGSSFGVLPGTRGG
jgi:amino acid transporter